MNIRSFHNFYTYAMSASKGWVVEKKDIESCTKRPWNSRMYNFVGSTLYIYHCDNTIYNKNKKGISKILYYYTILYYYFIHLLVRTTSVSVYFKKFEADSTKYNKKVVLVSVSIYNFMNPSKVTLYIRINARHIGTATTSSIACDSNDIVFIWIFTTSAKKAPSTVTLNT